MRIIPDRLLTDRITIKKPIQSFVPSTKKPVFAFEIVAQGVKARFDPTSTSMTRNVLGHAPKKIMKLFINPVDLKENYEVIRESDGKVFTVTEVKELFNHHLEIALEEKR